MSNHSRTHARPTTCGLAPPDRPRPGARGRAGRTRCDRGVTHGSCAVLSALEGVPPRAVVASSRSTAASFHRKRVPARRRHALHAAVVMIGSRRAVCARARAAEVERIPSRLPLAWLAGGGAVPPPGTQTTVAQRPPPRAERVGRTMIVQQLGTSSGRARAQSSVAADCNLGWRRAAAHYAHDTVEDMGL